jgi:excisionase family DNA binding protein
MLYKKCEAARLLRVAPKTVGKMIDDGRLKACVVGNSTRITREELDRFIGIRVATAKEKAIEKSKLIPRDIIKKLEGEMLDITHGTVFLTIHLRDHKPRFDIGRTQSFLPEDIEA